ncbi:unnamed protein product [Paramecium sonneborni]|uniref:Uncharacterized protein n=1 Tax=Paramecium sonneborni TaxID=65129 RepID=A0A8S1RKA3_9CILI|nr:unnamed protein product [Paramecium sonneborni]
MQNQIHSSNFKQHRKLMIFNQNHDASNIIQSSKNQQFKNKKNKYYPLLHLFPDTPQRNIKTDIDSEINRYFYPQQIKINRRCSHSTRRSQAEYNFSNNQLCSSFQKNKKDQACQTYFLDEFVTVEI